MSRGAYPHALYQATVTRAGGDPDFELSNDWRLRFRAPPRAESTPTVRVAALVATGWAPRHAQALELRNRRWHRAPSAEDRRYEQRANRRHNRVLVYMGKEECIEDRRTDDERW